MKSEPAIYPFGTGEGLELDPAYLVAQQAGGMIRVRLPFGEPAWLATRHADVRTVLGDARFSRAVAVNHDEPRYRESVVAPSILALDPPDHTRLRRLAASAFTVRRVEGLRPWVHDLAVRLVDEMTAAGPPVDLVEGLALPLPVEVICQLLGVPVDDRARFRVWSDALLSTTASTDAEFQLRLAELREYIRGLVETRRTAPGDDLMTALVDARDAAERLTEDELVDFCMTLLVAGHETTASQIPNFVYVLQEQRRRWEELRRSPELLPAAVEELMRFVPLSSGAAFARYAKEDLEVGGQLVRAGEPVLVSLAAANRDATRYESPAELRFDRDSGQHLGFGHGVHHCLGAPLARMELQETLRVLLDRMPTLRVTDGVEWKAGMLVSAPHVLPVVW